MARRLALYAIVLSLGYLFGVADHEGAVHPAEAAGKTEMAPDLVLKSLSGKKVNLKDYRGKWVFLNFWATWCPPCIDEMPAMEQFYRKFKEKNLTMLAVSIDKGGPEKVKAFVKEGKFTFEVFHDPESEASAKFGVFSLPSTFVINPKGEVVAQAKGGREWTDPAIIDYFKDLMERKK